MSQTTNDGQRQKWDRIRANRVRLRDECNVNLDELLRRLSDKGVFSHHEEEQIKEKIDAANRFDVFFRLLFYKNPERHLDDFLQALRDMGRDDVVDFLQGVMSYIG